MSTGNTLKMFDLQSFRSVIDRYGGLAKVARFGIKIHANGPGGFLTNQTNILNDLTFLCESAELPGRALNVMEYRYGGSGSKYPSQTLYSEMALTFICRNDMQERKFFDNWMEAINPSTSYEFGYKSFYTTQIDIYAFSDNNEGTVEFPVLKENYSAKLVKAYPINVNSMPVVWADENFHRLQVQFAFTEWQKINEPVSPSFPIIAGATLASSTL